MRAEELRVALRGLELIDVGAGWARIRAGDVQVALTIDTNRAWVEAAAPDATPLHVDATLGPLGALDIRTSDADFAAALLDPPARSRLERVVFDGGRARLAMGRWSIERADLRVPPRELVLAVAFVAARPRALAERWAAMAQRLGLTWTGTWNTRGGARLALPDPGGRRLVVDVIAIPPGAPPDEPARVRTAVWWQEDGASAPWQGGVSAPIRLGDRDGGHRSTPRFEAAWLWGVCDDAALIAQLASQVGASARAVPAPDAGAPAASIAPMSVADWPSSRRDFGGGRIGGAPAVWTPRPMPGSDAVIGLDEIVDVDGVEVHTQIVAAVSSEVPARVRIRAALLGAAPRLRARPGYHFLLAGLRRDDRLDDPAIDDRYIIHADDLPWARWWLGGLERQALLATFEAEAVVPFALAIDPTAGVAPRPNGGAGRVPTPHRVGAVTFDGGGLPPRRYLDAARQATAFLAGRAGRAADEWHALAGALGASVRGDTWTAGPAGPGFALVVERGAAQVTIAAATELPFDRGGPRLRTCVRAARRAEHRHALAVERDDLPRGHRLRLAAVGPLGERVVGPAGLTGHTDERRWAEARLTGCATPLARAACDALVLAADEVVLAWEGPVADPARLAAAIDAVAYLAIEVAPTGGPYR